MKKPIASKDELLLTYSRLTTVEQRLVQLKAVLFDLEYKTTFLDLLVSCGLREHDGVKIPSYKLKQLLDNCIKVGLISKEKCLVLPQILPTIYTIAILGDYAEFNLTAIKHAPGYRPRPTFNMDYDVGYDLRALQIAMCRNDFIVFTTPAQHVDERRYFTILLESIRARLPVIDLTMVEKLHPSIQLACSVALLAPQLNFISLNDHSLAPWVEFYKARIFATPANYFGYIKMQVDIALGNFTTLTTDLSQFPKDSPYLYATQGTMYFFANNFITAIEHYKKALQLEKQMLHKKLWFGYDMHAALYLLSMLATDDLHQSLEAIKLLSKNFYDEFIVLFIAIKALIYLQHNQPSNAAHVITRISFMIKTLHKNKNTAELPPLLMALLHYIDFVIEPESIQDVWSTYAHKQFASNAGYTLASHINASVLNAIDPQPKYQDFLTNSPFVEFKILSLMQVKSEWESILDKLKQTLVPIEQVKAKTNNSQVKRLVWLIDPAEVFIETIEQTQTAKGWWGKGKTIALKKLYNEAHELQYLTTQDKQALRGLTKEEKRWRQQDSYAWNLAKTIPALIGAPNVFHVDNRDVQLELTAGNVELNIEEVKDGFRFSLSHYQSIATVILEKETQNRYRVINYPQQIVAISSILPQQGLTVPIDAKERVLTIIQQTSSNAIQINTNVGGLEIPTRDGDVTCCLHVFPLADGLKINLGMRPFGELGPFYRPGHGMSSVIATIEVDGKEVRQKAIRDLVAEKQAAKDFISACPTLLAEDCNDDEWRFADLEACLEVLTEIESFSSLNIEWPQGQSLHVKQKISEKDLTLRIKADRNWFEYDGEIALNNSTVLSMEMLLNLVEGNRVGRFVKLKDGQFIALTNSFKKRLEQLKAISEDNKVFHLGAGLLEDLASEAKAVELDKAWQNHLARIKSMQGYVPKVPSTLQASLRDYQQDGYKYLARLANWQIGACLADDMGLGKTVQAIALILEQANNGPTLVIAPTSVCFNWLEELNKFAPTLNVHSLYASSTSDREDCIAKLKSRDVLICSYGLLQQIGEQLLPKKWQTIVLDEAQAIKNPQTQRWKYAVQLDGNCRLALTGTPIENHLGELWSIFRYLNPGLLGTPKSFQQRFAYPIEKHHSPAAKSALKSLVQPYILRRLKSEVLAELPAKTEQTILIEQSPEELAFYEALRKKALERISNLQKDNANTKRFSILAEITKLRQACCHSQLIDASININNTKIKTFLAIVQELIENQHKALVFSQYVRFLEKIKAVLVAANIKFQYIDGQTPVKARQQAVEKFQAGDGDLFLLSLKAGGTGLNLTAADYVIHLDPWWNPAVEDQASDRAHRIGQLRPVTIYRLIVKDTIEEKIIQMHKDKRDLASDLLSGGDVSGAMTEDELMGLLN